MSHTDPYWNDYCFDHEWTRLDGPCPKCASGRPPDKKDRDQDVNILQRILRELRMIRRELTRQRITTRIEVHFSGETMANSVELQVGQSSIATIEALASDGSPSNGVVSAVAFTFTNPDASFVNGADGVSGTVTGVEPSTGPLEGSVTCTVTDTDGAVSQFTQSFSVTVDPGTPPPPPVPTTTSVQVNFSTPA